MSKYYFVIKKIAVLLIGISFWIAAIYSIGIRIKFLDFSSIDLQQDFYAAQHLVHQESIYSDTEYVNFHPPLTALLIAPFTFLSYNNFAIIWTLLTIILYVITWRLVLKELAIHLPYQYLVLFFGFVLCWHPFLYNLGLGQWSILIGFCLVACWISLRHNRNILAGIILGIACLIKLTPGLFIIYLLFTKRWKAMASTAATACVGMLFQALFINTTDIIRYFTVIIPNDVNIFNTYPQNYSILGILGKFLTNGNFVKPIIISPIPINKLALIVDLVALFVLIGILLRLPNDSDNNDIKFAILIIATLFISPISWQHYLTMLTIPICLLLKKFMNKKVTGNFIYILSLLGLILLSLPDIQIGRFLMSLSAPNRLSWGLGIGFLFYDIGLVILIYLLLRLNRHGYGGTARPREPLA